MKKKKQSVKISANLPEQPAEKLKTEPSRSPYVQAFETIGDPVEPIKAVLAMTQEKIFEGVETMMIKTLDTTKEYCDANIEHLQKQIYEIKALLDFLAKHIAKVPCCPAKTTQDRHPHKASPQEEKTREKSQKT